jgi:hypothetical protein
MIDQNSNNRQSPEAVDLLAISESPIKGSPFLERLRRRLYRITHGTDPHAKNFIPSAAAPGRITGNQAQPAAPNP